MGTVVSLPKVFTDPDQITDRLLKGGQLSFTPDFIMKNSAISLECANRAREKYDEIGGECKWGFRNVFEKLMKEKIPSYAKNPAQLLALKYNGFYKKMWLIDEETGEPKLDDKGNKIPKNEVMWSMVHAKNLPEVFYKLAADKNNTFPEMSENMKTIHERVGGKDGNRIGSNAGARFYTFHSITNEEFEMFAEYLKEIKDGKVKGVSLK
jgi:hypothetical protein